MNNRSDQEWRAFQYLADELSAAEQVEFEQELETSESACDDLVNSVRLTQSLADAFGKEGTTVPNLTISNRAVDRKRTSHRTTYLPHWICFILLVGVTLALSYSMNVWKTDGKRVTNSKTLADNNNHQSVKAPTPDIVHLGLRRANDLISIWADIESVSSDDTAIDDVLFEDENEDEMQDDSFDWLHSALSNSSEGE